METADRPLRIEWFMLHAGYLRYYRPAIRLLAERGHEVHLAFTRLEKDPGDARARTRRSPATTRTSRTARRRCARRERRLAAARAASSAA